MIENTTHRSIPRRRVLQGLAVGVAGLAGCMGGDDEPGGDGNGGGNGGGTPQKGGTLRYAQVKSPIEFDPIVLNDVPSSEISGMVFEGLYEYDETTGHVPLLAAGEPEVEMDGKRWTVTIKDGATFQNGDPVTASDVKYSFEAPVAEETENANEVVMIDSITAVDESTVQFDLKYPFGPFQNTLHRSIVPETVREEDKEAFSTEQPVGSGPFSFDSWEEGKSATVVQNEEYWGEPMPRLDAIEFVPIEEATTRVTTLSNGDNDVIQEIPPQQWSTVEGLNNSRIDAVPGVGYFYLAFNCNEGPTTDPTVREAVDYVFDMDQAVSNFIEPTGVRQYSPLPKSVADAWEMPIEEWKTIPHGKDTDQAKQLFNEAGVDPNYSWKIIVPPDNKREQIGISVANGLKEVDFDATVQRLDWATFLEKYNTGKVNDYNMYTLGWSGTPDPDAFTYYLFGRTKDTLGVTNGSYWGNNSEEGKQAAQKFVDARQTADREQRRMLYIDGITTMLEQRAHLASYNLKNSYGVRNYVKEFTSHPVTQFSFISSYNNTWLSQQ